MAKLFYSYSHRDSPLRQKLDVALHALVREGLIESWHDRQIRPGQDWAQEIDSHLEEADIILLLISPDFIRSDYCYEREATRALERHAIGSAVVVPVILRPSSWSSSPFSHLQALPTDGKPITLWRNRDAAMQEVADGIRRLAMARTGASPSVRKRVQLLPRARNRYYTGRDETLDLVRQRFSSTDGPRIQVIAGLGGYGKTETALEYAYRNRNDYDVLLWFRSDTEAELRNDMLVSARALGVGPRDATNTDAALSACRSWLESHERWLVIFDNADDPSRVAAALPASIRGDVLVTSRSDDGEALPGAEVVALEPLGADAAAAFLLKRANSADAVRDGAAAVELAVELGGLPLALEQAAACVGALKTTVADYLASYRTRRLELLEEFKPATGDHRATIATTWTINVEEIQRTSTDSIDLLRACAFMVPDQIPVEIFVRGRRALGPDVARVLASAMSDPLTVPRILRPLRKYSLIKYDRASNAVTIHRLVQEVLRSTMAPDTRALWHRRCVDAVLEAFPIERLSPSDSVVHLTHALESCSVVTHKRRERELALLALLGPALIAAQGYASTRVGDVYARASVLLRPTDETFTRFQMVWGLWAFNYVRGQLGQARQLVATLERSARAVSGRQERAGYLVETLRASASTAFTQGRVKIARGQFLRALRLYDPGRHASHAHTFAVDPSIVCRSYLAVCDQLIHGSAAGVRACGALMTSATAQAHVFSRVYACFWAACSHQLRGDVQRARQAAADGLALSRQQFPQWDAMNEIVQAWCVTKQEDAGKGTSQLESALQKHQRTGAQTLGPYFLLLLADARNRQGLRSAARQALDLALAEATRTGEHTWTPMILQAQAEQAPAPQRSRLLRRATAMAGRQGVAGIAS